MTSGLTIVYRGPTGMEHHRVEFEDDRTPQFSEDTIRYDESTGHWVVSMDEPPAREVPGWPKPGTPRETPIDVRIPREQVLLANRWKPYDGPSTPAQKPDADAISAEVVYDTPAEYDSGEPSPNVINDLNVEFLDPPSFDSEMDHWRYRFHEFDAIDGDGNTREVTQFIPRERIRYVYTTQNDGTRTGESDRVVEP